MRLSITEQEQRYLIELILYDNDFYETNIEMALDENDQDTVKHHKAILDENNKLLNKIRRAK